MDTQQILSNLAIGESHGENSMYFEGWKAYQTDPFHPTTNPNGVIQMGLAENQLCPDLIVEWIKQNQSASICTAQGIDAFMTTALFQDYHGLPCFTNAVANFMGKTRAGRVKFDPARIVMGGGATGANEMLMFCLANPGDAFLIPTPYYPAFDRDLSWRTRVNLIHVTCKSSNNFKITKEALEEAYDNAQKMNIPIKGLILANPSNPLGTFLDKTELKDLVTFTNHKQIHLVCDEIYAATVFNTSRFISISEVIQDLEYCDRRFIHIVGSLSKDMGLPGFRVGIIYSYNDQVVNCARKMSSFGLVSSQTQFLLASMLSDEKFVDKFLLQTSTRLAMRHDKFVKRLEEVGIKCLKSNAGLFCWMDLRQLLESPTFECELRLWRVIVNDVKINVSPGSSFHCHEPGWFRVCFANMDDETMDIALGRMALFVGKTEGVNKKKSWQKNLRLSFTKLFFNENVVVSPRMMSPQSPSIAPCSC